MEQQSFFCEIYVDEDVIYSGDLSEMPERFRSRLTGDISEWADHLGKRGINELLYSHLAYYEKKAKYCQGCEKMVEDSDTIECKVCESELVEHYIYDRNEKIDKIMTCIGMISKIRVGK